MTDEDVRPDPATPRGHEGQGSRLAPRSEDEARAWAILERARQQMKPRVKVELEGEVVSADILTLRLKSHA